MARLDVRGAAAVCTLTGSLDSSTTTAALTGDTSGWPTGSTGRNFPVIIDRGLATMEKVLASDLTAGVLTFTRAQDGTSASAHAAGATVEHGIFASLIDDLGAHVYDTTRDDHTQYLDVAGVRQVDTVNIADDAVTTDQIVDSAVTSAKIADATIVVGDIANDAIETAKIKDGQITEAKFSSAFWHRATFSVTSGTSGDSTIPHGASFTPTAVFISFTGPSATPNVVAGYVVRSIDGTNVVVRCTAAQSGVAAGLLASGQTLAGTILSLA